MKLPGAERLGKRLEEGQKQGGLRRRRRRIVERARGGKAAHRLPEVLPARRKPARVADDELQIIIVETDEPKGEGHGEHRPHEAVRKVRPQQSADQGRHQDERAAHRGRARLRQVRLWPVVAHHLSDLIARQARDHAGTDEERDHKRRGHRENGAQGEVGEYVKPRLHQAQMLGQPRRACGPTPLARAGAAVSASTTRSRRFMREPLTSRRTPRIGAGDERSRERVGIGEPLAAGAKALNRSHRQRAGRKQPLDAVRRARRRRSRRGLIAQSRRAPPCRRARAISCRRVARAPRSPARTELGLAL